MAFGYTSDRLFGSGGVVGSAIPVFFGGLTQRFFFGEGICFYCLGNYRNDPHFDK